MSRKDYERLFMSRPPEGGEEDPMIELVSLLARAASLRRAARELADEELLEGHHVEDEPSVEAPAVRLAAHDAGEQATYRGGPFRVRVEREDDGVARITQLDGPAGLTVGLGERRVPLVLARAVEVGALAVLPEALRGWDAQGRRWRLVRDGAG